MPEQSHTRGTYLCSFCGKNRDQVERLIAGPRGVYICNECVTLCWEIINEQPQDKPAETNASNKPTIEHP